MKKENTVTTKTKRDAILKEQSDTADKLRKGRGGAGKNAGMISILTPEDIKDAVIVMSYYAERGIRTSAAWTQKALEVYKDIYGDALKKHLPEIWNTLRSKGVVEGEYNPDGSTPPVKGQSDIIQPFVPGPAPTPAPVQTTTASIPAQPAKQRAPWHMPGCPGCANSTVLGFIFSNGGQTVHPCQTCEAMAIPKGMPTMKDYKIWVGTDGVINFQLKNPTIGANGGVLFGTDQAPTPRPEGTKPRELPRSLFDAAKDVGVNIGTLPTFDPRRIAESNNTIVEPKKTRKWSKIFCGENMNRKIMIFTIAVIILMCFYPPWLRKFIYTNYPGDAGKINIIQSPIQSRYGFLFTPPEGWTHEVRVNQTMTITASIDILRLLVQCVIVLLAGGGLTVLYRSKNENS